MKRSFTYFLFAVLAVLTAIPSAYASEAGQAADKLVKIVVLSRHGVRSPTQNRTTLDQWSNKTWPRWPVRYGYLTERGHELVTAQWKAIRPVLMEQGLLPENACPASASYTLIADRDQRTRETAIAIFDGLAPGCGVRPQWGEQYDSLFHPSRNDLAALNTEKVLSVLKGRVDKLNADPDAIAALNRIQDITDCCGPALCARTAHENSCALTELPNRTSLDRRKNKPEIGGKWAIASSIAEIMLLEYGQWPGKNAGWGQVDESVLRQIVPLHDKVFDAVNRTPALAKAGGRELLKTIESTLLSDTSPKLNFLVGHDTNIANIGGLLNIDWNVPEQGKNPTPPGGFLTFELWQKADGSREVRVNYNAPTFTSLHTQPAPVVRPVQVPASPGIFTPDAFSSKVRQLVQP